ARLALISRGRSIYCEDGGLSQLILASPEINTYTVRGLIEVVSGTVEVDFYGILDDETTETVKRIEMQFRETGSVLEYQATVTFDESDIKYLRFTADAESGEYYFVQTLVCLVYHPGPFLPCTVTIILYTPFSD